MFASSTKPAGQSSVFGGSTATPFGQSLFPNSVCIRLARTLDQTKADTNDGDATAAATATATTAADRWCVAWTVTK